MEEKQKLTLWQLQDKLAELDELSNDDEYLANFIGDTQAKLADKIDSIKSVIDTLSAESEKYKRYASEFANKGKVLARAVERLEAYVIQSLEAHGTNFEVGNLWAAKIKLSERVEMAVEADEAMASDSLFFDLIGKECIKISYAWDKRVCKEMIKSGQLDKFGKISQSKSLNFSIKKG